MEDVTRKDRKSSADDERSPKDKKESYAEEIRGNIGGSEGIEQLRERLYARGAQQERRGRRSLSDITEKTERSLGRLREKVESRGRNKRESRKEDANDSDTAPTALGPAAGRQLPENAGTSATPPQKIGIMARTKKPKKYRLILVLAAVVFFVGALGVSTLFLLNGTNQISGENISIDVSGPFSVGGGQKMPLQIAIANQNTVPIESATLIIEYPPGTQSAAELGREIFTDRRQLNNIGTGEVVNVPVEAVIFGEENEEKTINVAIEYRVRGSNATFFKEAEPLRFKISSSPIVLSVDSVKRISSGQEVEIELTVTSNSPTPLSDILVKASYPFGFDFTSSKPSPVSAQDTWFIASLEPKEEETITLTGVVTGGKDEERVFSFSVGVPNEQDRFDLASIFMTVTSEIALEEPFFGVGVAINGEESETVVINSNGTAGVEISFINVLEDVIYDGEVEAKLSGSALNDVNINVNKGFYDSSTDVVRWDFVDVEELGEIEPGQKRVVSFRIEPEDDLGRTPEIKMEVTVRGQRVFEDRVPQELVGTAMRTVRISSDIELASSALYSEGPFTNTGPTPPVAEEVTQYTLLFSVRNSTNDITGTEMTAVLPQYMTWLDLVTPGDNVTYDSVTRTITWRIGDVEAGGYEEAWVQVSFLPSASQVDTTPTILETQRLRATDRFTGAVVRDTATALTTSLRDDPDKNARDGQVQGD